MHQAKLHKNKNNICTKQNQMILVIQKISSIITNKNPSPKTHSKIHKTMCTNKICIKDKICKETTTFRIYTQSIKYPKHSSHLN
jgi:hypothetical protein